MIPLAPVRPAVSALVLAAAVLAAPQAAPAAVGDRYAVVAYSPATGRYGYGYGYASRGAAEVAALNRCGTTDARVVAWTRNGYIAVARGTGRSIGWAHASDPATARRLALAACLRYSDTSRIVVCVSARR